MNNGVEIYSGAIDSQGCRHMRFQSLSLIGALRAAADWIEEPQTSEGEIVVGGKVIVAQDADDPSIVDIAYTVGNL